MHKALFYGCGTALVTPFRGNRVDFDALEGLIDWQIESGVDALIVLGTTGEASTVTASERSAIIECAVSRCARRVPLIVGTGSNNTRTAMRQSIEAQMLGADALLVVTPYYNKASREGLIEHYTAIADNVELPIILYNVPGRTGMCLQPETVAELAKHPLLCAVKEASGNLRQMTDMAAACDGGIAVYCGNDDQLLPAMALGARGVISVASNLIPAQVRRMTTACLEGNYARCREELFRWLPLLRALFDEVNPIPVKAALSLMRRVENNLRLPLMPLSGRRLEGLRALMEGYGLL